MMYKEFLELLPVKRDLPTEDYYHKVVEPSYNKSSLNKEEWVSMWVQMGGLDAFKHECERVIDAYNDAQNARNKELAFYCDIYNRDGAQRLAEHIVSLVGDKELFMSALKYGKLTERQQSELYKLLNAEEK